MVRFLWIKILILSLPFNTAIAGTPSTGTSATAAKSADSLSSTPKSIDEDEDDKDDGNQSSASKEKEEGELSTFTDTVKSIRSVSGEYDVFFVKHHGPYSVPFSLPNAKKNDKAPDELLSKAHKLGIPITVTVNTNTETLVAIDSAELNRAPAAAPPPAYDLPPDFEYLREFIDKPSKPKN